MKIVLKAFRNFTVLSLAALLLFAPPRMEKSTLAAENDAGLAKSLQPFVDSHMLAGAVLLVADKDKVLALETVGSADIAGGKPMRPDNLFWIASMSKPITATALMILVDEGKVQIDDPVQKFLPEFKDLWLAVEQDQEHVVLKRPSHPITVREILSHTSGMPFRSAMEQPTLDALALRDAVRSYAMTPLVFEPGTKYQYSNAGINTAGRIIEVVSGVPYEDFLQKRLFDRVGMKDTTFWPNTEQLVRLAKSYKPDAKKNGLEETTVGQLQYPLDNRRRGPMPGGGLFSTASDCSNFCRMVLAGGIFDGQRILSEESVRTMTTRQTGEGIKESYGLGWSAGPTFGHGGAFRTNMSIDSQKQLVLVFLVQHTDFPGSEGAKIQPTFVKAAMDAFAK